MSEMEKPPSPKPPPSSFLSGQGRIFRLIRKEVTTILRDRRTIVTLLLMPILLYPLIIIGFQQFLLANAIGSKPPVGFRIGLSGEFEERLLGPFLVRGEREVRRRRTPEEKERAYERTYRIQLEQGGGGPVISVSEDFEEDLRKRKIDLAIQIVNIEELRNLIPATRNAEGELELRPKGRYVIRCRLISLQGSLRSQEAKNYIQEVIHLMNERALIRLSNSEELRNDPRASRLVISRQEVEPEDKGGGMKGLIPLVLILMTITGAVYPAIDLTAGERERGTLEILIAAPIPRMSLLFAKYVSVLTVALLTALVNLISMAVSMEVTGISDIVIDGGLTFVLILQVLGLLVLLAALFSGILLAVTSFARSFKEAQVYLIPLMLFSLTPGMISLIPGIKAKGALLVVPLMNVVLLARDLFNGDATGISVLVVVISTLIYALTAIAIAARIFGAEAVLYSEQGGFGDLFRRPSDSTPVPGMSTAMLCLALMFPIHFLITNGLKGFPLEWMLILIPLISIVLFVALPLAFCQWGKIRWRSAFRSQKGAVLLWVPAVLLGVSLLPLASETGTFFREIGFKGIPDEMIEKLNKGIDQMRAYGPIVMVLVMGIVPAVTEELFFRGFLFSAFQSKVRPRIAIFATAAFFALFHLLTKGGIAVERLVPTFLMGLALGWLAWRSGSVVPGILLHASYNSTLMVIAYLKPQLEAEGSPLAKEHLPLDWLAIAGGAAVFSFLLTWILTRGSKSPTRSGSVAAS